MPRCSVRFCENKAGHRFPRDPDRRKLWLLAIRREDFQATEDSRICREHFLPSDYALPRGSIRRNPLPLLKPDAVPSQFSWTKVPKTKNVLQNEPEQKKKGDIKNKMVQPNSIVNKSKDLPQKVYKSHKTKVIEKQAPPQHNPNDIRHKSVRLQDRKAHLELSQCSVPYCKSKASKVITLHPCPNNAAVRNDWVGALHVSYQYVKKMVICSLHFRKTDFIQSIHSGEWALKPYAVPSRNLPRIKQEESLKKPVPCKENTRLQTMTENVHGKTNGDEESRECRTCLMEFDNKKSWCNVFQAWTPPWSGMEPSIAEDLAKLANVEISITDRHSKIICAQCYQQLLDSAMFAARVRNCDFLLRQRIAADVGIEKVWPKPIQVDKSIDGLVYNNAIEVEVKQEVVSEEEYANDVTENAYVETEAPNMDIKIEPEEIVEPPPMNITINGTISLDSFNSQLSNGTEEHLEQNCSNVEVKQEPMSEEELGIEQAPDLPLECLLCTKSFNSVTGLKAHVIALHSYKSVKRKSDGSISPERKRTNKYQCVICRRSFVTSTDLMVHETCHNKHACYGCNEKFDTFDLLTRHRKRCKASQLMSVQKLKTLEDVKRPLPKEKVEYLEQEFMEKELKSEMEQDNNNLKEENKKIDVENGTKALVSKMEQQRKINSDSNIIVTAAKGTDTDENILDSDLKISDSDLKIAESDLKLADSDVKIADNDVKVEDSDVKMADNEVKTEDSDVKMVDSDVKMADSDVKIADNNGKTTDNDIKIENNDVKITSSEVHLSVSEKIDPNSTVTQETDLEKNEHNDNMNINLDEHSGNNETESNILNDIEMELERIHEDCK